MDHRYKNARILVAMLLFILCDVPSVHALPTVTPGGLLEFADNFNAEDDFDHAFPNLPMEDFEESPIGAGSFDYCTGPLDSSTNQPPNCFVPGDILPGISLDSEPGHQLAALGSNVGTLTTASVTIGNTPGSDIMTITFAGGDVQAVGMDLAASIAPVTYTVKIYGTGNTLLETLSYDITTTSEKFIGLYAFEPITRITLDNGVSEIVDNIRFGGFLSNMTLYTDLSAFQAANQGLAIEDFEESPVAPATTVVFPEPLDNTTNAPGAFAPGDILDDIHISTIPVPFEPQTDLQVLGENFSLMANTSKTVCSHADVVDDLRIQFAKEAGIKFEIDTYAVGIDLMQRDFPPGSPTQKAIMSTYDIFGRLLGATVVNVEAGKENFFGISSLEPIVTITFQFVNPIYECIDNIRFGGSLKGLTLYETEADFERAHANLPREDFSESPVADDTTWTCTEPINSATNEAGCFMPGDILPHISFQTESSLDPACPACLLLEGPNTGFLGNTTPLLRVDSPDRLEITFPGKMVQYIGFRHFESAAITLYDADDNLLGTTYDWLNTSIMAFRGIESAVPVSRITFNGVLDEVIFGPKFPWPSFLPAITGNEGSSQQ